MFFLNSFSAWPAGWPASAALGPSNNSVVWWSDSGGLSLWDSTSAELQRPIYFVPFNDPPPPAHNVPTSLDGRMVIAYGSFIVLCECATGLFLCCCCWGNFCVLNLLDERQSCVSRWIQHRGKKRRSHWTNLWRTRNFCEFWRTTCQNRSCHLIK